MNLSKFFNTGNQAPAQRREKEAMTPPKKVEPTEGTSNATQVDFFYGSSSDLRKKAPKK